MILNKKKLSKQEVAMQQLATAVNLYAKNGDIVSIHNLTSSAYQIACDIEKWKNYNEMICSMNFQNWGFVKNIEIVKVIENIIYAEAISKNKDKEKIKNIISDIKEVFSNEDENNLERFISAYEDDLVKIIKDMKKPLNLIERLVDDLIENKIFKGKKSDCYKALKAGYNFLKHSDRDPREFYVYDKGQTDSLLFVTCQYYYKVFEDVPSILARYTLWWKLNNPSLLTSSQDELILSYANELNISIDDKQGFFNDVITI